MVGGRVGWKFGRLVFRFINVRGGRYGYVVVVRVRVDGRF